MEKDFLINGPEAFERILKRIGECSRSIYITMFIWRDDAIGNKVAEAVLAAADRGVKIRIVKDVIGSIFEKGEECRQSMFHKDFNFTIAVKEYVLLLGYFRHVWYLERKQKPNATAKKILSHPNIVLESAVRNDHSKFYIFDDEILIMGGVNIEDKENSQDYKNKKWSDYMIELRDKQVVREFLERYDNPIKPVANPEVDFSFNVKSKNIYQVKNKLFELMDGAQSKIDIEMAYFGDPEVTKKIIACTKRGIELSILTSEESNLQTSLNMQILNKIYKEAAGKVNIYLSKRVVHSKLICIDDSLMFFGSANYNKKGMIELSELNTLFHVDEKILSKWKSWRTQFIEQECFLYKGEEKLPYSKVYALVESVLC